jgi:hypothetical protein
MASDSPVIGLLFGVQNGLDISIIDAADAIYEGKLFSTLLKYRKRRSFSQLFMQATSCLAGILLQKAIL